MKEFPRTPLILGPLQRLQTLPSHLCTYRGPTQQKLRKDEARTFETLDETGLLSVQTLQPKLMSPPVSALLRSPGRYLIDTDRCRKQISCVLLQQQPDGHDKPIGYWSRSLNTAVHAYGTKDRECLRVVWAVLLLRPYLEDSRFTIRADHDALKWILNLADASR